MKAFLLALISARLLAKYSTDHIQKEVQIIRKYWGYYRRSKKTDYVWSCLFLSFGAIICADAASTLQPKIQLQSIKELQIWLPGIKDAVMNSKAWLYAPSSDVHDNCRTKRLHCYLLELKVIIFEEEIKKSSIIYNMLKGLGVSDENTYCPPCEAHTVQNATIFLERLTVFLQRLSSSGH